MADQSVSVDTAFGPVTIRPATPGDAETLCALINGLAEYERLRDESDPDPSALRSHLEANADPRCEALIAETFTGEALGFALFFQNYSTFLTRWGMYLEDLFVRPDFRGQGIGFALLKRLATIAVERGCGRLEWSVLDWNEPAVAFYERIGAEKMPQWMLMRVGGKALEDLAAR